MSRDAGRRHRRAADDPRDRRRRRPGPGHRPGLPWQAHHHQSQGGGRLGLRLHPRPAGLLVLNEPETSLHLQPLAPVAQLITAAAARSQIIAVSHSQTLINALHRATGGSRRSRPASSSLIKDFGETRVAGREPLDGPAWRWPKR